MTNNVEWKRKQAARLLLQGLTPLEVAKLLEVKRDTVMEWQYHADFRSEIAALMQDLKAQMDMQMLRAGLMQFQKHNEAAQHYTWEEDFLFKMNKIYRILKNNDFIPKTSHESPMNLPMEALDLSEFVAPKT